MSGYEGFIPFTGFDPMDGDDPRFTLSRDNPLSIEPRQRRASSNQPAPLTNGDCAIRGGVKGLGAHLGSFNYTPGSSE